VKDPKLHAEDQGRSVNMGNGILRLRGGDDDVDIEIAFYPWWAGIAGFYLRTGRINRDAGKVACIRDLVEIEQIRRENEGRATGEDAPPPH